MIAPRFPLSVGLVLVALATLGIMGIREQSPLWSGSVQTLTVLLLLATLITSIFARGRRRAFSLGFTLAGGVVLVWSSLAREDVILAPVTEHLAKLACESIFAPAEMAPPPTRTPDDDPASTVLSDKRAHYNVRNPGIVGGSRAPIVWFDRRYALQTFRCLFALLAATLGGLWAAYEHARFSRPRSENASVHGIP